MAQVWNCIGEASQALQKCCILGRSSVYIGICSTWAGPTGAASCAELVFHHPTQMQRLQKFKNPCWARNCNVVLCTLHSPNTPCSMAHLCSSWNHSHTMPMHVFFSQYPLSILGRLELRSGPPCVSFSRLCIHKCPVSATWIPSLGEIACLPAMAQAPGAQGRASRACGKPSSVGGGFTPFNMYSGSTYLLRR